MANAIKVLFTFQMDHLKYQIAIEVLRNPRVSLM